MCGDNRMKEGSYFSPSGLSPFFYSQNNRLLCDINLIDLFPAKHNEGRIDHYRRRAHIPSGSNSLSSSPFTYPLFCPFQLFYSFHYFVFHSCHLIRSYFFLQTLRPVSLHLGVAEFIYGTSQFMKIYYFSSRLLPVWKVVMQGDR